MGTLPFCWRYSIPYHLVNKHSFGESPFSMGKLTIPHFQSYVKLPEGISYQTIFFVWGYARLAMKATCWSKSCQARWFSFRPITFHMPEAGWFDPAHPWIFISLKNTTRVGIWFLNIFDGPHMDGSQLRGKLWNCGIVATCQKPAPLVKMKRIFCRW